MREIKNGGDAVTTLNKKKVNGYTYADGFRDRDMNPTKGVSNAKLEALKKKIKK